MAGRLLLVWLADNVYGEAQIRVQYMSPVLITVVIPAYNVDKYIEYCLASVSSQTYGAWRCIVVDDGSTDSTRQSAMDWPDARVDVIAQLNKGVSAARNAGLAQAADGFVMFLDGDDVLHPTALMRLQEKLGENPAAVATFGSFSKILSDGSSYPGEKALRRVNFPTGDVLDRMVRGNFLANGGHVLIRTEAAQRAGGFDERLRLSEDWEFWCRLALQGPFVYVGSQPECLRLRVAPTSASGGLAQNWEAHQPAIEAVLANPAIQARYSSAEWSRLQEEVRSTHLWEAARVNFTLRHFPLARRMMLEVLRRRPRVKRVAQFLMAEVSRAVGRPILSRYRFRDLDIRDGRRKPLLLEGPPEQS